MAWNQGQQQHVPPPPPPSSGGYGAEGSRNSYFAPTPGLNPGCPASPMQSTPGPGFGTAGNRSSYYAPPPGSGEYQPLPTARQQPARQSWGGPPVTDPGYAGYAGYASQHQQQQHRFPGYETQPPPQQSPPPPPSQTGSYNPQTYSTQGYNPQTYSPQTYSPQAYNPQTYSPHPYNPRTYTPHAQHSTQPQAVQSPHTPQTYTPQPSQAYTPPATQSQSPLVPPTHAAQSPQSYAPPRPQGDSSQPVAPPAQPYPPSSTPQTYANSTPETHLPPAPQGYTPQSHTAQITQSYIPPTPQTSATSHNAQTYPHGIPMTQPPTVQSPLSHEYNSQQYASTQSYTAQSPQSHFPQTDQGHGSHPGHSPQGYSPDHRPPSSQPQAVQIQASPEPQTYQAPQSSITQSHSFQSAGPQLDVPQPNVVPLYPATAQQPQAQSPNQTTETSIEQRLSNINLNDTSLSDAPAIGVTQTQPQSMDGGQPETVGGTQQDDGPSNPFLSMLQQQQTAAVLSTATKNSGLSMTTMSALNSQSSAETNPFTAMLGSQANTTTQPAFEKARTETIAPQTWSETRTEAVVQALADIDNAETNPFSVGLEVDKSRSQVASLTTLLGLQAFSPQAKPPAPSEPPQRREKGAVACLRKPSTIPIMWYSHPLAPNFDICSYCFEHHFWDTPFESAFQGTVHQDGQPRWCNFNCPFFKDLFEEKLATNDLDDFVLFIQSRVAEPACAGADGVPGTADTEWFVPKNNDIPGMVVCRACLEDYVLSRTFTSGSFERTSLEQGEDEVWSCDFALKFIQNEYLRKGDDDDWEGFCSAAQQRLAFLPCPKTETVEAETRAWFKPTSGLQDFLICGACYFEHVHLTEEHTNWELIPDGSEEVAGNVRCRLGEDNTAEAMDMAIEFKDMGIFWRAAVKLREDPVCHPDGMSNTTWYTLTSDPAAFAICAGCCHGMVEPWGMTHLFMEKPGTNIETTLLCSFNREAPRFEKYMWKAAEAFYTREPNVLADYISEYAAIPVCARDQDFTGRTWFGWDECTICPECHHDVVRGSALAHSMPLQGEAIPDRRLCELYSPKMRGLYADACASASPAALLAASLERRRVYFETVPPMRRIMMEGMFLMAKQQRLADASQTDGLRPTSGSGDGMQQGSWREQQADAAAVDAQLGNMMAAVKILDEAWKEAE